MIAYGVTCLALQQAAVWEEQSSLSASLRKAPAQAWDPLPPVRSETNWETGTVPCESQTVIARIRRFRV